MRIHGFHPVREALRSGRRIDEVWIAEGRSGGRVREILELARRAGVRVRRVPGEQLGGEQAIHNGIAAVSGAELAAAPADGSSGRDADLVLLVEDVQDPRNLGAIVRVAEGAGAGRVLVRDRGAAPLSEAAVKASAGAASWLPVERIPNTAQALAELKDEGFWVYGLAVGGVPPWEVDLSGQVVLCVGGESDGLRDLTRRSCDRLIGLPMRGRIESLNVASACAAVLYEAVRQRSRPAPASGALSPATPSR